MPTRSEVIAARRKAVGGKRRRCRRGKPCSAACINRNKFCLVDAPTPVAGALPRAVRAIQSRKERLGRKDQQQLSQRRKEFAKGKLKESAKLREQRTKYVKERNSLRVRIQRAIFSGERSEEKKLRAKLERLEKVGAKLGVSGVKPIDNNEAQSRFSDTRRLYIKRLATIQSKMSRAANSLNRSVYDREEKKLLNLIDKARNSYLRLIPGDRESAPAASFLYYRKGKLWKEVEDRLKPQRAANLNKVYDKLIADARQAAKDGDLDKYRSLERKIVRIHSSAGDRLKTIERPKGGSIWLKERLPGILKSLKSEMSDALSASDLKRYNNLESKLIKIQEKYKSLGGYDGGYYQRGRLLEEYTYRLKEGMREAIKLKSRKMYNKLEENLLKLDPDEKKGRMWKEELTKPFLNTLGPRLKEAAERGNRKEFNKIRKMMLKLDPSRSKWAEGVWKEAVKDKIYGYIANLEREMGNSIKENNRGKYDKLEARLFRIIKKTDKLGFISKYTDRNTTPGKMWRDASGVKSLSSLNTEDQFKKAEKKTSIMGRALRSAAADVYRLLDYVQNYGNRKNIISVDDIGKFEELRRKAGFNINDAIMAIQAYTYSEWTRRIRLAQRKGSKGEAARYARDLENFLRWGEVPRPQVEKFRGFRTSPTRLEEMIRSANLKERFNHDTAYSWSSSLRVGRDFADKKQRGADKSERVIFRAVNKKGVPIEYVSRIPLEHEILTHRDVNYKYIGYRPVVVDGVTYHIFDVKELD